VFQPDAGTDRTTKAACCRFNSIVVAFPSNCPLVFQPAADTDRTTNCPLVFQPAADTDRTTNPLVLQPLCWH